MIDERKEEAITLIIQGEQFIDIAKLVGIARSTLYDWMENKEFKTELDKRRQEIKVQGNNLILNELGSYIKELKHIALCDKSAKVRSDTAQYLVDRVLGKTTTKIETNVEQDNSNNVSKDILKDVFSEGKETFNEVGQGIKE